MASQRLGRALACESLERRVLLQGDPAPDWAGLGTEADDFRAVIVAGDPSGSPADSPSNRLDANTATSPFAGVGSLRINTSSGTYICTATPIGQQHVLTAGHCLDINNDGRVTSKDGVQSVYFQLNTDVDSPTDQVGAGIDPGLIPGSDAAPESR
jgi:hypothetical protein